MPSRTLEEDMSDEPPSVRIAVRHPHETVPADDVLR